MCLCLSLHSPHHSTAHDLPRRIDDGGRDERSLSESSCFEHVRVVTMVGTAEEVILASDNSTHRRLLRLRLEP